MVATAFVDGVTAATTPKGAYSTRVRPSSPVYARADRSSTPGLFVAQIRFFCSLSCQRPMLDYNNFVGQIGIGRLLTGSVQKGQSVFLTRPDGKKTSCKVMKIEKFVGLGRVESDKATAGDIAAIAGLTGVEVGDTLCTAQDLTPLHQVSVDAPTISMEFLVNDSPFAGKEGKFIMSRHLKARLEKEAQTNVGLKIVELPGEGRFKVSGRGELHLTVLIETMRREGFELAVSRPEVI